MFIDKAWAYETALWNASLTGVRHRNRSILLLTAGIQDQWEPNDDELGSLTQLFMQADEDPTGAVIAVRQGVDASEIRDPSSIWGISQEYDFLTTLKMRALGVSEAYLSGEVNVSTMEAARTSLGKQLSTFRDMVLTEIFQRQLFPTFARIHNFQKRTKAEIAHGIRLTPGSRAAREAETLAPIRFVTSYEVRDEPITGDIAKFGHSIFVERRNYSTLRQDIHTIADSLRSGDNVGLFPEGTTTCGRMLPWKSSLLQAAMLAPRVNVVPVAIQYLEINGEPVTPENHDSIYYYGCNMSFKEHLAGLFDVQSIKVRLTILPPVQGRSRKDLTRRARQAVALLLG